ncbi:MAG: SAM-dependent methyltransferase [Clostridia bacterium]|nr:SAM-dependent methyltransferase [Clostridia bacterium]
MKSISLDERLASAAALVRDGATLADIGTDHAYLPIYLLSVGRIRAAVCSDINRGPLERAEANVAQAGFSEAVSFRLCDGAGELFEYGATDYAICGMGGELISKIIEGAPYLKNPEYHLILQPMSRASALREYLGASGFIVLRETYSESCGKRYVTILAEYSGEKRTQTRLEAEFGKSLEYYHTDPLAKGYADERLAALYRAARGKMLGGEGCPSELTLYNEAKRLTEEK